MSFEVSHRYASTYTSYQSYYVWDELMTKYGTWGSGLLTLFDEGCRRGSNGTNDCAAACEDLSAVWASEGSIFTMHNCMVYPIIIQLYNENNLTNASIEIANEFNIIPTDVSASANDRVVLSNCVSDFCKDADPKDTPGCFLPYSTLNHSTYFFAGPNCTGTQNDTDGDYCYLYFDLEYNPYICQDVVRNLGVNLDIAGIGMLVAYIIQVAVVLLTCVLWHCLQDWAKLGVFIHYKVWKRSEDPWIPADKVQARLKKSKLYASFIKALAEFQKAQVFFLAAVLVAALIAWFHPLVLSNDPSQQPDDHDQQRVAATLSKNFNILTDLTYAGTFPIVLGLLTLRNAGKRDTYTLVISTFPLILAVIVLIVTAGEASSQSEVAIAPSGGPESCAGVKPTDYCFPSTYTPGMLARIGGGPVAICFVVFLGVVFERLKLFRDHSQPPALHRMDNNQGNVLVRIWRTIADSTAHRQNIFHALRDWTLRHQRLWVRYERFVQDHRPLHWLSTIHLDTADHLLHTLSKLLLLAAEITLAAFNIVLLHEYARIISPKDYRVSDFQFWTLGQVIAVTVWFPVAVEFGWDCYDGIAKTLESRILPDAYRVVRIDHHQGQQNAPVATDDDDAASGVHLHPLPAIGLYEPLRADGA